MMKFKTAVTGVAVAFAVIASATVWAAKQDCKEIRLPGKGIALTKGKKDVRFDTHRSRGENKDVFFESFEYPESQYLWDESTADIAWLPEGWSRRSDAPVQGDLDRWYAHPLEYITLIPCYEGEYAMAILYNSEYKDEWLISPEIAVGEGEWLTFGWYYLPAYFWVIDRNHVDFENGVFTKREIAATMKVMVQVDGDEWVELKDMSDDFADKDYEELFSMYPEDMMEAHVSLADYAGKSIKVAFRYVGADGNSMFIDGVSVNGGNAQTHALYMPPITSLYVGGTVDMQIADVGIEVHPADCNLQWLNCSQNADETDYDWSWVGELPVTDKDSEVLDVNFAIPSGAEGLPYDLYLPPMLKAEAVGSRSNTYSENVLLMAGGKPVDDFAQYGLLPFDLHNDGIGIYLREPEDFGQRGIPVFGYSDATDRFWRLYTCGGREENLSTIPYAYVSGIVNAILVGEKPLVVDGSWLYVIGKISDEAQFNCSVYALDEDGAFDRLLASKTIKGSDVLNLDTELSLFYYTLPFKFDQPIVLDSEGSEGGLYAIVVTGFHDGGVEYFAPMMQTLPNKFETCLGFYQIEYMYEGQHNIGLSFVANHENENGEMYCAFAINLDAHYPWLECNNTQLSFDNGEAILNLQSYYAASDLNVTLESGKPLPAGLTVTKTGRYNNAQIKFALTDVDVHLDENIVVSAPGVSKTVRLKSAAGIDDVLMNENATVKDIYDLTGRRVAPGNSQKGFYIIRNSDGTVVKTHVK